MPSELTGRERDRAVRRLALLPGERILWLGKPPRTLGNPLVWTVFLSGAIAVILSFVYAYPSGRTLAQPGRTPLSQVLEYGGVALIVGAVVIAKQLYGERPARGTYYAVTNRRVAVGIRKQATVARSLPLGRVADVVVRKRFGGWYSVDFPVSAGRRETPSFARVADGNRVRALVFEARGDLRLSLLEPGVFGAMTAEPGLPLSRLPAHLRLEPGEQVLWSARPVCAPLHFGPADLAVSLPGAALLAAAAGVGAAAAFGHRISSLPVLVPALAVLAGAGLYLSVGRFLHRRMRISRAVYVLTTERLITTWRLRVPVVVQCALADLPPMRVRGWDLLPERRSKRRRPRGGRGGISTALLGPMGAGPRPALIAVADPEGTLRLIEESRARAGAGAPGLAQDR